MSFQEFYEHDKPFDFTNFGQWGSDSEHLESLGTTLRLDEVFTDYQTVACAVASVFFAALCVHETDPEVFGNVVARLLVDKGEFHRIGNC